MVLTAICTLLGHKEHRYPHNGHTVQTEWCTWHAARSQKYRPPSQRTNTDHPHNGHTVQTKMVHAASCKVTKKQTTFATYKHRSPWRCTKTTYCCKHSQASRGRLSSSTCRRFDGGRDQQSAVVRWDLSLRIETWAYVLMEDVTSSPLLYGEIWAYVLRSELMYWRRTWPAVRCCTLISELKFELCHLHDQPMYGEIWA